MAPQSKSLKKHLSIIASDDFEGRNTGSLGQLKAARYISEVYRNAGLLPPVQTSYGMSYFQDIPLKRGKIDKLLFRIGERELSWGNELTGIAIYYPTQKDLKTVFAGFGIDTKEYSDYDGLDLKGKMAIIFWGEPKTSDGKFLLTGEERSSAWGTRYGIYKKVKAARALGAEDVLVIMPSQEDFENRKKTLDRYTSKGSYVLPGEDDFEGKKSKYGTLYTYPEAFARFYDLNPKSFGKEVNAYLDGGKKPKINEATLSIKTEFSLADVVTSNVLGYIPGSEKKNEFVILTAHYDHLGKSGDDIYNGADDDGSGTAALLSIAEKFGKSYQEGVRPKRSILFMAFTGEEKGLLGSKYYCDQSPVIPLEQTVVDLNIDMIGRIDEDNEGDSNYVYLIGSDMLSSTVHELSEHANTECCKVRLDYTFNNFQDPNNFYKRSDHYNFAKYDIPVIFYFNGSHEDYHKPTDTIDKINWGVYARRTKLIYHTALKIANYDGIIEADKSFDEPTE